MYLKLIKEPVWNWNNIISQEGDKSPKFNYIKSIKFGWNKNNTLLSVFKCNMDAHLCVVPTNLHNLIHLCTFSSPNSSCGLFLYLPQHPLFLTFTLVRWSSECWCSLDAHVQMQLSPLCYLFPLPVTHWCSLAPLDHYSPLSLLGCKNTMKITIILHDYS